MRTRSVNRLLPVAAGAITCAFMSVASLHATVTGQWDFESGNLATTLVGGPDLTYGDTETQNGTDFGTTTSLGIPGVNGEEASVMMFPATPPLTGGYSAPAYMNANGGGTLVNQWTLVMDVLYPTDSNGRWRVLADVDMGREFENADGEFFVNTGNGIGISSRYDGQILPDTWHRVVLVVDQSAGVNQLRKYIDGIEVGIQDAGGVDGRWAITPYVSVDLFADNDGDVAPGYVNSIQLHDVALSKAQVGALGGPTADGIPETLPAAPSNFESFIPAGEYALGDTDVGVVVAVNEAVINTGSVKLLLDGAEQTGVDVNTAAGLMTVSKTPDSPFALGSKHTVQVTYTETVGGIPADREFNHEFRVALFLEDFDGLTLNPSEDENYGENYFTKEPPEGWLVDDSQMPGYGTPEYPDNNGVNEFSGWSFVNYKGWVQTAGDQERSQFTKADGAVAVADPDEWDDATHLQGLFNTFMTTPVLSLEGASGVPTLKFDSSWRPEAHDDGPPGFPEGDINNQTATVEVSWNGGAFVELLRWDSVSGSPYYKPDNDYINETVQLTLDAPEGATSLQLRFGLSEAANDWWWAVDNLAVLVGAAPPSILTEPADTQVNEGDLAELTVEAAGTEPLTYQWFRQTPGGDVEVAGATAATLSIPSATLADSGAYKVVITNEAGQAESRYAQLQVLLAPASMVVFEEDFNSLPLGDSVDERQDGTGTTGPVYNNVWTKTPPAGWSIDDTGVPNGGVTEWHGWSFATVEFWNDVAAQNRNQFTKGTGAVAIADGDEWDDLGHDAGTMNTYLSTPAIGISDVKAGSLKLQVDVSWNPENEQKANITASYDGNPEVELIRFDSSVPADLNGTVSLALDNPAGAQSVVLTFGYFDAGNNWWVAVDNIKLTGEPAPLFFEDFNGLAFGPSVDEGVAGPVGDAGGTVAEGVWTDVPPAGWIDDDTGVPGIGEASNNNGVFEWAGWNFADRDWWVTTAGDQRRSEFVNASGGIMVADADEWDDADHPGGPPEGPWYNTFISTPSISVTGVGANTLALDFDSSWRPEFDSDYHQTGNITVSFDGAGPIEVLRWESDSASANYHGHVPNEHVTVALHNPAGASEAVITFGLFDAGNDWWWAIDNVEVNEKAAGEGAHVGVTLDGQNLTITWDTAGTLQFTPALDQPWTDVEGATSPHQTTADGAAGFFQVRD